MKLHVPSSLAALAVVGAMILAPAAYAQDARAQDARSQGGQAQGAQAQGARAVCRPDLVKLCQTQMEQRDRQAVRACLIKNMDRLSDGCRSQLKQMMAKRAANAN